MFDFDKSELIPTEDNKHPLLKLEGRDRTNFVLRSVSVTLSITVLLYLVPSYWFLENITTQSSYFVLDAFGFRPRLFIYEDPLTDLGPIDLFFYNLFDSSRLTYPAISIGSAWQRSNYIIVRACTGMQAGALLVGLIWSTPAKTHDRIRASYTILVALFIGNFLRIATMIAITTIFTYEFGLTYDLAWDLAHNWLGRPLGFFGTIAFTILIEVRDVKILDTITVWIDEIMRTKPKKDTEDTGSPEDVESSEEASK